MAACRSWLRACRGKLPSWRRFPRRRVPRRALVAVALYGLLPAVTGTAAAGFAGTTSSTDNSLTAGTVSLTTNGSGSALLSLSNVGLGTTDTSCIRVTYTGSLPAMMKMYATMPATNPLAAYLTLTITRGSGEAGYRDCTGFTPDTRDYLGAGQGVVYSGTLAAYPANLSAALVDLGSVDGLTETWTTTEYHSYKFVVTLPAGAPSSAVEGRSASAAFIWEAANL